MAVHEENCIRMCEKLRACLGTELFIWFWDGGNLLGAHKRFQKTGLFPQLELFCSHAHPQALHILGHP